LLHLDENHSILVHAINSPLKPLFYFVFGKSIIKQAWKINSIFHSFLFILWDSSDKKYNNAITILGTWRIFVGVMLFLPAIKPGRSPGDFGRQVIAIPLKSMVYLV